MDRLAALGFDWLLSVWQTGPAAQAGVTQQRRMAQGVSGNPAGIARGRHRQLRVRYPELHCPSRSWRCCGLAVLRQRLQQRGPKLMLDFVPNHMAPDHPWVDEHPDYFVQGGESDLAHAL